jgi:hypothetical protein
LLIVDLPHIGCTQHPIKSADPLPSRLLDGMWTSD